MTRFCAALMLAAALALAAAGSASAQVPADATWETIESAHFRVTYVRGLESLARRAAASAERAHAGLSTLVADAPRGTIDIVITDNVDFSNGYAMPFPANRIVVYAKPPVDMLELQYTEDWIDMVVVHELAHIFHFDVAGGLGRALRTVFGRVPFSWPFFPVVGTPTWGIEGLAVGIESTLTGAGRIHGSYHEMVVRTAVLEGRMDDFDRMGGASPLWPGQARVYIYGSLFMDYLTRRYGPDATARVVRASGGAIVPPALWFGQTGRSALGVTFSTAYREWQQELETRYATLADRVHGAGLTRGEPLTEHGAFAFYPRFSPDGSAIAYAANDWRSRPETRVIDAASGERRWRRRSNDLAALAWLPDGAVVTSDMDFADRFRIFSDLHVVGGPAPRRLSRSARLQHPDASRDGRRIVAVENRDGTNRIVLVDAVSGARRAVTQFDEHVQWALPRFDPAGGRIAAGRWRTGGDYEVVVIDTLGRTLIEVTRSGGISAAPAWSPDGHWLLFWSDRTGIPNLFAAEIGLMAGDEAAGAAVPGGDRLAAVPPPSALPRLRQVTSVLTGAYFPDVSPDGRWIAFSAYDHDGFRIERMPFDTAAWRDPMPDGFAGERTVYEWPAHADAFVRDVRDAVARADTAAGPPRPYQAARHLRPYTWMPVFETGGFRKDFVGVWSYGSDLVDRHRWDATVAASPGSGQTQGRAGYTWAGLPARAVLGMHPTVSAGVAREWELVDEDRDEERYIDQREDRAQLGVALSAVRWRARGSLGFNGEVVRRSRYLVGYPAGFSLRDAVDNLAGVRGSAVFSSFIVPPFAISRENGVTLQLAGRRRWDRDPGEFTDQEGRVFRFDRAYRELTTWNAGYLALPLPGFARHALAARVSGLYRDGPGAGVTGIGGASGAPVGLGIPGFSGDIGGTSRLLPLRGYPENARYGSRAWTAAAEYRLPLTMISTGLAPLPIYLDRMSAALFLDAGQAWCDAATAVRFGPRTCAFTSAADAPLLLGAGLETTIFLAVYGSSIPVRAGFGVPLGDSERTTPRAYILISTGF